MLKWMSAVEAADVEGVTPGTVRRWGRQGKVERRVGDDGFEYLIDDPDLEEDGTPIDWGAPAVVLEENQVSVRLPGAFMIAVVVLLVSAILAVWVLL